eukprot:g12978.t1 g12978   contig7:591468-593583(+)
MHFVFVLVNSFGVQFQTISDNTFWNSLKAKAEEILDSVQIYIENRVERDSQTLAAVGLFALDRIQRDISRALPAAGRQVKKLLLGSNSTYAEKLMDATENTIFALPSERSMTERELDSYEEMTTPADEIKQVTEAIRDILSGKELPASSAATRRRGVRSLAPAGTSRLAERQQRAYQARKKTVLQREKEGMDRTLGRAIGSVTDATWELKQEMSSGAGREAGYRSKGVRKALAAGAVKMLEAGRERSNRLLGRGNANNMLTGDTVSGAVGEMDDTINIVDVTAVEEEEIIEEVILETNLEYAPDGLLSPQSFMEEKRRLIASLESCLSQPGQMWLTKEVVTQATESGISLDGDMLREVITTMVAFRDELKSEIIKEDEGDRAYLKIDYVQAELRRMKQMVDSVTSLAVSAAGEWAAYLLKQELEGFVLSDTLDEIIEIELERMEQLLAEMVADREREIKATEEFSSGFTESSQFFADPVVQSEVVEVTVDQPMRSRKNDQFQDVLFTEVEVVPSYAISQDGYSNQQILIQDSGLDLDQSYQSRPSSTVEVVSDDEYSDYEQRFKSAQSSAAIEEGDEESEEDNPVIKLMLRIVDAIFFVGEKFFLDGLPGIIMTGSNVSMRYSKAKNRGSGNAGWRLVRNVKLKKNQY